MFTRILTTVAFAAMTILPISRAEAHPKLLSATPAVDSRIADAPTTLSLTFNEKITLALSTVTLVDAAQKPVTLDSLHSGKDDAKTLVTKVVGAMAPGRYTVKWTAAGGDGHPMKGEFSFTVDAAK
jgi:methionine-rich copper-binding protein CopC